MLYYYIIIYYAHIENIFYFPFHLINSGVLLLSKFCVHYRNC